MVEKSLNVAGTLPDPTRSDQPIARIMRPTAWHSLDKPPIRMIALALAA
jgi:hypothetical protein